MVILRIIVVSLLFNSMAYAQYDVNYFVQKAVENSPVMAEKQELIAISKLEQERLRRDLLGPRAYISADYLLAPYFNNRKFIDTNPGPQAIGYDAGITNGGLYSGLININQPIFAGKTLNAYLESEQSVQKKYLYNEELTSHNLKRKVTDQYIKVYQNQRMIEMNRFLLAIIKDQQSVVDKLTTAGLLKRSDAILISLEKDRHKSKLYMLKSQWGQDLIDLYLLCGLPDTATHIVLEKPKITMDREKTGKSSFLNQYNLDSLAIADSLSVYDTKYRPVLSLFGNAGLNAVELDNIQRKVGFSAGIGLTVPIYDGHQRGINKQKIRLSLKSISGYKDAKVREVAHNIIKYKLAVETLEKNMETLEDQIENYSILLEQYKAEIKAGQLSIIDYINGLKLYQQARIDLINSRVDLLKMKNAYNYWNW